MMNCSDTIRLDVNVQRGMAYATAAVARPRPTWRSVGTDIVILLLGTLYQMQKNARDRKSLQLLDDRMLKDVGLTRADLDRELENGFSLIRSRRK